MNEYTFPVAPGGHCQERGYSSQVWSSWEEISLSCRQPKSQVFLECRKSVHLKFLLLGLALPSGVLCLQPRNAYERENPAQSLTALPIRSPKTWRKELLGQEICVGNPDTWRLSLIEMIKSNSQPGAASCPSSSSSPVGIKVNQREEKQKTKTLRLSTDLGTLWSAYVMKVEINQHWSALYEY